MKAVFSAGPVDGGFVVRAFGDIYLVRTNTLWGKLVRFWTRSKFSHAGIVTWKNKGIEATLRGVRIVNLSEYDRDQVVFLTPKDCMAPAQRREISKFLYAKVNSHAGYDFSAILGFIFFKKWQNPKKWYCFELAFRAYEVAGIKIARLDENFIDGHTLYNSLQLRVRGE